MEPLIARMIHDEPEKRPTMDEAMTSLEEVLSKLSNCQLSARLVKHKDGLVMNVLKDLHHTSLRTIPRLLSRRPPLPTPRS